MRKYQGTVYPKKYAHGFALLCFVVVIHWLIFPYPSGLFHWHCGNLTIAPVPAKQPWWIWINTSCEFIMNDCITTTKQRTTKPCAYFLGYTLKRNHGPHSALIHCSFATSYSVTKIGHHWFRLWLAAWWLQVIICLRAISQEMFILSTLDLSMKVMKLRLQAHLSGANGLSDGMMTVVQLLSVFILTY